MPLVRPVHAAFVPHDSCRTNDLQTASYRTSRILRLKAIVRVLMVASGIAFNMLTYHSNDMVTFDILDIFVNIRYRAPSGLCRAVCVEF